MTTPEPKHPADELGKALSRASGVLTLVTGCYEKSSQSFDMNLSYIYESVAAVEGMLQQANDALGRLYETCDLGFIGAVSEASETEEAAPPTSLATPTSPVSELSASAPHHFANGSYLGFFGPPDQVANLSDRLDNILVNMPARARTRSAEVIDRPAQNYDELLQKVTALADAAAYQAHQTPGDATLVPVLEGLRADLMRLKAG